MRRLYAPAALNKIVAARGNGPCITPRNARWAALIAGDAIISPTESVRVKYGRDSYLELQSNNSCTHLVDHHPPEIRLPIMYGVVTGILAEAAIMNAVEVAIDNYHLIAGVTATLAGCIGIPYAAAWVSAKNIQVEGSSSSVITFPKDSPMWSYRSGSGYANEWYSELQWGVGPLILRRSAKNLTHVAIHRVNHPDMWDANEARVSPIEHADVWCGSTAMESLAADSAGTLLLAKDNINFGIITADKCPILRPVLTPKTVAAIYDLVGRYQGSHQDELKQFTESIHKYVSVANNM